MVRKPTVFRRAAEPLRSAENFGGRPNGHRFPRNLDNFMKKRFITVTEKKSTVGRELGRHLATGEGAAILKAGGVWLNRQRLLDPGHPLHRGETLTLFSSRDQGRIYRLEDSQVLYHQDDLLAVVKPAGINVQADHACLACNLTAAVHHYLGGGFAPTAVTRLDLPVQGIVLFACSSQAEQELFRLMREGRVRKKYIALLEPGPGPTRLRVRDRLAFTDRARQAPQGKPAHTLFCLHSRAESFHRYHVALFTGRRHQIRAHAAGYLRPILGDRRYGARSRLAAQSIGLLASGYNLAWRGRKVRLRLADVEKRVNGLLG